MDYYEKKFIRDGARKLRAKAFMDHIDGLRTVFGDTAADKELLSELPVRGVLIMDPYIDYYTKNLK